jgi:hypothetical protein
VRPREDLARLTVLIDVSTQETILVSLVSISTKNVQAKSGNTTFREI